MKHSSEIPIMLKENPVFKVLIMLILMAWIVFAVSMFEVNPGFFGVTILLAVIFILNIKRYLMIASAESLILKEVPLTPLFKKQYEIFYKEMDSVDYQDGEVNGLVMIISFIFLGTINFAHKEPAIFITLKDGTMLTLKPPKYDNDDNRELVKVVKTQIAREQEVEP